MNVKTIIGLSNSFIGRQHIFHQFRDGMGAADAGSTDASVLCWAKALTGPEFY